MNLVDSKSQNGFSEEVQCMKFCHEFYTAESPFWPLKVRIVNSIYSNGLETTLKNDVSRPNSWYLDFEAYKPYIRTWITRMISQLIKLFEKK